MVTPAGTNDVAEDTGPTTLAAIEDNLISMVDLAKKNGIRVVIYSILPASSYPWRPEIHPVEKISALNELDHRLRCEGGFSIPRLPLGNGQR
jgi:acyl-CoA thioesterase-1